MQELIANALSFNKASSAIPFYNIMGGITRGGEADLINDYGQDGGLGALRKKTILDTDIDHKLLRNPLASNQILRMMEDPFAGGLKISSDNTDLMDMVEQLIDQVQFETMIQRAYAYSRGYGAGFLYLDLAIRSTENKTDPVSPYPQNLIRKWKEDDKVKYDFSKIIRMITPMSRKQVKAPLIEEGTGKYIGWEIYTGGHLMQSEIVHADRIIYIPHWYLSGTWKGRSWLEPQFNSLNDFEDAHVTLIETLIKNASGYLYIKLPFRSMLDGSLPDIDRPKVTSKDKEAAKNILTNPHVKKSAIIDSSWDFDSVSMTGGVDPANYMREIKQAVSMAGRIPAIIMSGSDAGQLTGYEWVVKQFHNWVRIQQKNYEKYYRDFINRLQAWKILPGGSIRFEWGPIDQPTAKEQSDIRKTDASSMFIVTQSIEKWLNDGWTPLIRNGKLYMTKETIDGRIQGIELPGISTIELDDIDPKKDYLEDIGKKYKFEEETPAQTPEPEDQDENAVNKYNLTKEELDQLRKDYGIGPIIDAHVPTGTTRLSASIDNAFSLYMGQVEDILKSNGVNSMTNADVPAAAAEAILDLVDSLNFDTNEEVYEALERITNRALKEGWENISVMVGFPEDWKPGSEYAQKYLTTNIKPLTKGIKTDITNALERAMADGIKKGLGYQEIFRSMEGAKGKYTKSSVGKVVHKVVHNAVNSAKAEAAYESGFLDRKKGEIVYLSQGDDLVRPEHRAREGNVYPARMIDELFADWNCRCTWIFPLAIEKIRGPKSREDYLIGPEE